MRVRYHWAPGAQEGQPVEGCHMKPDDNTTLTRPSPYRQASQAQHGNLSNIPRSARTASLSGFVELMPQACVHMRRQSVHTRKASATLRLPLCLPKAAIQADPMETLHRKSSCFRHPCQARHSQMNVEASLTFSWLSRGCRMQFGLNHSTSGSF